MVNYSHVLRMLHWLNLEGKKFPSLSPLIKTSVHWPLPEPPFISIDLLFVICYECMYKLKDCSLHVNQQSIIFLFVFFLFFFYHMVLSLILLQQGMKSGLTIISVFRLDNFGVRIHKNFVKPCNHANNFAINSSTCIIIEVVLTMYSSFIWCFLPLVFNFYFYLCLGRGFSCILFYAYCLAIATDPSSNFT